MNAEHSSLGQMGQAILSLAVVVVLLLGLAWLIQRLQGRKLFGAQSALDPSLRLGIESTLYLDPKTRLVLVRRGRVGHLLCVNAQGVALVEQGIALPERAVTTIEEKPDA